MCVPCPSIEKKADELDDETTLFERIFGQGLEEDDGAEEALDDPAREAPAAPVEPPGQVRAELPPAPPPADSDVVVHLDFGRIVYYARRNEFVAECHRAEHGRRCRRSRTALGNASRPAQGRPLAQLACWIENGSVEGLADSEAHKWSVWPDLAEREAKRASIMGDPAWADMLSKERQVRPGEPDEPVGLA